MLDFGQAVRLFYKNYLNPDGRAQRSAYWWVQLYQTIIDIVLAIVILMADGGINFIESIFGIQSVEALNAIWSELGASGKGAVWGLLLFSAANFLPGIMLAIRRFHDLDVSGWLVLVFFVASNIPPIAIFATIANFVWFAVPGTTGPNRFGADPLETHTDTFG